MKEKIKQRLKPLMDFKGSPHELALAFGIGVALGVVPGTGAVAAAALAAVFRLNLPVAVAGALLINPITAPFLYLGSFQLGSWLLGGWLPSGVVARVALGTLAGNLLLALALSGVGYLAALFLISHFRPRRSKS